MPALDSIPTHAGAKATPLRPRPAKDLEMSSRRRHVRNTFHDTGGRPTKAELFGRRLEPSEVARMRGDAEYTTLEGCGAMKGALVKDLLRPPTARHRHENTRPSRTTTHAPCRLPAPANASEEQEVFRVAVCERATDYVDVALKGVVDAGVCDFRYNRVEEEGREARKGLRNR